MLSVGLGLSIWSASEDGSYGDTESQSACTSAETVSGFTGALGCRRLGPVPAPSLSFRA